MSTKKQKHDEPQHPPEPAEPLTLKEEIENASIPNDLKVLLAKIAEKIE